uniref:hypothetical protein n=1 Tax=Castellaniella defragrans TaxID=75697 RepID=UPI00333F25FA
MTGRASAAFNRTNQPDPQMKHHPEPSSINQNNLLENGYTYGNSRGEHTQGENESKSFNLHVMASGKITGGFAASLIR